MNKQDAEEYTQALGQIVIGSWRQVALAKRLGVPNALGLSVDEWVNVRLGGYLKLAIEDRREAVKELTDEGMSTREIGDVLGVSDTTVVRDQAASNEAAKQETPPKANGRASNEAEEETPADREAREKKDLEKSVRETIYRVTESTYRGIVSFANKEFIDDLMKRLPEQKFRNELISRCHLDLKEIKHIEKGAIALRDVLQKAKEKSK